MLNPRILLPGLVVIAILVGFGYLLKTGLGGLIDEAWIDAYVRDQGVRGPLLFLLIAALATAVGLPRQLVSFLGGYAFGFAAGCLLALAACTGGCVISFHAARLLGRRFLSARFPDRIRKADDFLKENPFTMALLIRLLPLGNNLATSLAAGVSSVGGPRFIAGSALGYIPQTVVFALLGSGINLEPGMRIASSVVLFVLSAGLGVHLYRKYHHDKSMDEAIDARLTETAGEGRD